jgi:hypothetical protein
VTLLQIVNAAFFAAFVLQWVLCIHKEYRPGESQMFGCCLFSGIATAILVALWALCHSLLEALK